MHAVHQTQKYDQEVHEHYAYSKDLLGCDEHYKIIAAPIN